MLNPRKFLIPVMMLLVVGCGTTEEPQHGLFVWTGPHQSSASEPQENFENLGAENVSLGLVKLTSRDGHTYAVRKTTFKLKTEQGTPDIRDLSLWYCAKSSCTEISSSSMNGDAVTFDLRTSSTQALVTSSGEFDLQLSGKIVGGIGSIFQFYVQENGIEAEEIGSAETASPAPISGQFPLNLLHTTIVGGGIKATLAANSPDGTKPLPLSSPQQTLLVADVEALGEDMLLTDVQFNFVAFGSSKHVLSNLFLRDNVGTGIGSKVEVLENYYSVTNYFQPQFQQRVNYLIPKGQVRQLYFYADTNSAAGSVDNIGLHIWGQGARTMAKTRQYSVSGPVQGLIIK